MIYNAIMTHFEWHTKFINDGDNVYCLYELASAFDTVEFSGLLKELFHAGVREVLETQLTMAL